MNLAKNMEFVLVTAIALVTLTGIATAAIPPASTTVAAARFDGKMQVVTVTGKRLSAAAKARTAI
ncbi:MAG: hypothetical protein ABIT83_16305 [Massilia sp.]